MNFNSHYELEGEHSFLSASSYHWINYDDEKLATVYRNKQETQHGTRLHELSAELIQLGIKLPKTKATLNQYVNDAIGFRMSPEVILYYSRNAFGTADTISFRNNLLRIHDLKTGLTRVSFKQLYVYVAYFCLEYREDPRKIDIALRMYKDNIIEGENWEEVVPDPEDILIIMDKIIRFDTIITDIRMEK